MSQTIAPYKQPFNQKRARLFVVLCGIFITNALLAEVIGVKIFSAEKLLGIAPAQLKLFLDTPLDFNLTAGVLIWPVVFVTSDIINEYFGKGGVRFISFLTAGLIAFSFIIILAATQMPPANFWMQVNADVDGSGKYDIDKAYGLIFRQGLGIIIGSLIAFLIGQLLDAAVFHWVRKKTGEKYIWLRATGSTLVSQAIDSFVVLIIAFYVFGNWSWAMVISVSVINYLYKGVVAILLTPVLYLAHFAIDRYLKDEGDGTQDESIPPSKVKRQAMVGD